MCKFSIWYWNEPENSEPPEPKFVLQNQTSNFPNHPKKTEPSLLRVLNVLNVPT